MKISEVLKLNVGDCFCCGDSTILYILEKDVEKEVFIVVKSESYKESLWCDYGWCDLMCNTYWIRNKAVNTYDSTRLKNMETDLKETLLKYFKAQYIKWVIKEEKDEDTIPIVHGDTPVGV